MCMLLCMDVVIMNMFQIATLFDFVRHAVSEHIITTAELLLVAIFVFCCS